MKKQKANFLLLFSLFILISAGLKSQAFFADALTERVQVCTDRTLYITGESILFYAFIYNTKNKQADRYSRILYCELITPDGTRIAGGKYPLVHGSAQGCLPIPEESLTGIYYLKSYTRFMRNGSTDNYHYVMLKIVNPSKEEVLGGQNATMGSNINKIETKATEENRSITLHAEKSSYQPREKVNVKIQETNKKKMPGNLCVSVIPEFTVDPGTITEKNNKSHLADETYFPETRGISLTGHVLEKKTGRPVNGIKVNLSVIGDKDIMVIRTDTAGRFFFALPGYFGNRDIFLCAEDVPDINPQLYIDNDFCPRPVHLASPVFTLNKEEKEAAYKLAVNERILSIFNPDTISTDTINYSSAVPFYGKPAESLVLDDYIELPTLEEYFNELPMQVKVRKSEGRRHFRFYSRQSDISIFEPLILIDWVAVDRTENILSMSPKDIDRIELVNSTYIKGNIIFGGIISFVSKKNDFAGIDLPGSGTFINYQFLEACPDTPLSTSLPAHDPDARNTIYWEPELHAGSNGSAEISFTAPDTPGNYIILLRAIDLSGNVTETKAVFEVKAN